MQPLLIPSVTKLQANDIFSYIESELFKDVKITESKSSLVKNFKVSTIITLFDYMLIKNMLNKISYKMVGRPSSGNFHHTYSNGHFVHILGMMQMASRLFKHLTPWQQFNIKLACLLHDLEKIGLDNEFGCSNFITENVIEVTKKFNSYVYLNRNINSKDQSRFTELLTGQDKYVIKKTSYLVDNCNFKIDGGSIECTTFDDTTIRLVSNAVKWHHGLWTPGYDTIDVMLPCECLCVDDCLDKKDNHYLADDYIVMNALIVLDQLSANGIDCIPDLYTDLNNNKLLLNKTLDVNLNEFNKLLSSVGMISIR